MCHRYFRTSFFFFITLAPFDFTTNDLIIDVYQLLNIYTIQFICPCVLTQYTLNTSTHIFCLTFSDKSTICKYEIQKRPAFNTIQLRENHKNAKFLTANKTCVTTCRQSVQYCKQTVVLCKFF